MERYGGYDEPRQETFFERHRRPLIGGAAIALTIATVSTIIPPETSEYRGAEAIIDTEYVKVYEIVGENGKPGWPFSFDPNGEEQSKIAQAGLRFEVTPAEQAAAIVEAEIRDTSKGTYTCADGSKVDYIIVGDFTKAEMEENYCEGAEDSADAKRSKEIEDTGSNDNGNSSGSGSKSGCMKYQNGERILCEAKKWEGVYYQWAGGHTTHDNFVKKCPDPRRPNLKAGNKKNAAHGGTRAQHNGNPNPCGVDCSGLVSQAVNRAFGRNDANWVVAGIKHDTNDWKRIPMREAKAGDVVTKGANDHVEIVRHMKGNIAHTFGAHRTGYKIDNSSGKYDAAYRYIGKGSTY